MSVLNRLSLIELFDYTHRGWFVFCPIYFAEEGFDGCRIIERNWVPRWLLGLAEMAHAASIFVLTVIDRDYEPAFMVWLTGEIARSGRA